MGEKVTDKTMANANDFQHSSENCSIQYSPCHGMNKASRFHVLNEVYYHLSLLFWQGLLSIEQIMMPAIILARFHKHAH